MKKLLLALGLALVLPAHAQKTETATFAGGCFWCVEEAFDKLPGVVSTASGFMGGHKKNPTYDEVTRGNTGHTESVQVVYDPAKISYDQLLDHFWVNHDPTVTDRQFCDSGSWYRPVIFYHTDEQRGLAEASKRRWDTKKPFKQPLRTPIEPAREVWPAEGYHQDYYKKNALQYKFYVTGCGRYTRLDSLWGALRR
jgi:peptide-methionine (S)-S-oxide reductase